MINYLFVLPKSLILSNKRQKSIILQDCIPRAVRDMTYIRMSTQTAFASYTYFIAQDSMSP